MVDVLLQLADDLTLKVKFERHGVKGFILVFIQIFIIISVILKNIY